MVLDSEISAPVAGRQIDVPTGDYVPELDGLRAIAFLAVFMHHLPPSDFGGLRAIHQFGWVGVEAFFAVSAYLFFRLLNNEHRISGSISIKRFYARRVLRIYPVMLTFPIAALLVARGDLVGLKDMSGHYLQLATGATNLRVAAAGYATTIPYADHLWTLSFELQIYLVMPFLFLLHKNISAAKFLCVLLGIWFVAMAMRALAVSLDATHPLIWVTPVLRPESILVGIILAISRPLVPIAIPAIAGLAAASLLVSGSNVDAITVRQILIYPLAAAMAGCVLYVAQHQDALAKAMRSWPLRYMGKISYCLYVYHIMAIALVLSAMRTWFDADPVWGVVATASIALSVALASAAHFIVEAPALRLKRHFAGASVAV